VRITVVEFSPSGGLYQFAVQLASGMGAIGHTVDLLTGADPEFEVGHGVRQVTILPTWHPAAGADSAGLVRIVRRGYRAGRYVLAWLRIGRYLRRERPDVVQFAEWRFALDGWLLRTVLARARPPVVADIAHTPVPLNERRRSATLQKSGPLLRRSLRRAYERTDVVFVLGEQSRRDFRAAYPSVTNVQVIPHGDEGLYLSAEPSPAGEAPPTVLFFGGLARYKGLDLLLDAFEVVLTSCREARLVIAGPVVDIDLPQLRARAEDVGRVEVRAEYVPVDQVEGLVTGARLVVTPYSAANQSGVVQVAHTLARPVVATDVGDLGEAVRHGETGLLVTRGSASALAAAITELLDDPVLATRLGTAAREQTRATRSWPEVAARVCAVYTDLLRKRQQQSPAPAMPCPGAPSRAT